MNTGLRLPKVGETWRYSGFVDSTWEILELGTDERGEFIRMRNLSNDHESRYRVRAFQQCHDKWQQMDEVEASRPVVRRCVECLRVVDIVPDYRNRATLCQPCGTLVDPFDEEVYDDDYEEDLDY